MNISANPQFLIRHNKQSAVASQGNWLLALLIAFSLLPAPSQAEGSLLGAFREKSNDRSCQIFRDVMDKIRQEYVDEVSEKNLLAAALDGMLRSLDQHSAFLDDKALSDFSIGVNGEFSGIGVDLIVEKSRMQIITPYPDSPAFKAGVKVGDIIYAINNKILDKESISEVAEMLRGDPGSTVKLTVERAKVGKVELTIERELLKIIPVHSKLIAKDIAYIDINIFNSQTVNEVAEQYRKIANGNKLKGIIIDLRWNPGGLFEQAIKTTDLFLEDGEIVSLRGKNLQYDEHFYAEKGDITGGLPIVILVNGGTASAPEIVTGALQDNGRAIVIGTKTFGKASVQSIIPLGNGDAIKLTTARYYTPNDKLIEEWGIMPDISVVVDKNISSESPSHDLQLSKAISYLRSTSDKNSTKSPHQTALKNM